METTVSVSDTNDTGFFDTVLNVPAWIFGVSILGTAALAGGITYLITGGESTIKGKVEIPKTASDETRKAIKASIPPLVQAVLDAAEKQPHNYKDTLVNLLMEDYTEALPSVLDMMQTPSAVIFAPKFLALAKPLGIQTDRIQSAYADVLFSLKTDIINTAEKNGTASVDLLARARKHLQSFRDRVISVTPPAAEDVQPAAQAA